jgi:hypothetical protein
MANMIWIGDGGKIMIHSIMWLVKKICLVLFVTFLSVSVTVWIIGNYMQQVLHDLNITVPTPLVLLQESLFSSYSGQEGLAQPISKPWLATSPTLLDQAVDRAPFLHSDEESDAINKLKNLWREGKLVVSQNTMASTLMSKEEIELQKQALTAKDKMDILSLLISKVPQAEVDLMLNLISDGLTHQEAMEIDALLQKYLNQQEYDYISQIIKKYEQLRGHTS